MNVRLTDNSRIVPTQVNPKLPDPVKSIHLTYLNLTDTPAIDLVSHHVTTVTCDDARFKRYTLDFDISFNNPGENSIVKYSVIHHSGNTSLELYLLAYKFHC